jgi:hypothetical protein
VVCSVNSRQRRDSDSEGLRVEVRLKCDKVLHGYYEDVTRCHKLLHGCYKGGTVMVKA